MTGKSGSGKDYVASALGNPFERFAFADVLKEIHYTALGIDLDTLESKKEVNRKIWKVLAEDIIKTVGVIHYGKTLVEYFTTILKLPMKVEGYIIARAIVFMLIVTILQLFVETKFITNFPKIKYQLDLMLKAITYYLVINATEEVFEGLFGFLQDIKIDNIKEAYISPNL